MKPNAHPERRRERRVEARLQIELQLDPGAPSHASSTLNISSNGVYFLSPRYIEPLTRLGLRLVLPEAGEEVADAPVECTGVVVRCVPETSRSGAHHYEVACYFTDTSEDFKERLSRYVQKHL